VNPSQPEASKTSRRGRLKANFWPLTDEHRGADKFHSWRKCRPVLLEEGGRSGGDDFQKTFTSHGKKPGSIREQGWRRSGQRRGEQEGGRK